MSLLVRLHLFVCPVLVVDKSFHQHSTIPHPPALHKPWTHLPARPRQPIVVREPTAVCLFTPTLCTPVSARGARRPPTSPPLKQNGSSRRFSRTRLRTFNRPRSYLLVSSGSPLNSRRNRTSSQSPPQQKLSPSGPFRRLPDPTQAYLLCLSTQTRTQQRRTQLHRNLTISDTPPVPAPK